MSEEILNNEDCFHSIDHYLVENEIDVEIGTTFEKEVATFIISVAIDTTEKFLKINRSNFKVNGEDVTGKFALISLYYMDTLFPFNLNFKNQVFKVSNTAEILERIKKKDQFLAAQYNGAGFDHIRNEFLNKVNTKKKINDFIVDLNFIKIFNYCHNEFNTEKISWKIIPISNVEFNGTIEFEDNNKYYDAEIIEKNIFFNDLGQYVKNYSLNFDFDGASCDFYSGLRHSVEGLKENFNFDRAITYVNLALNNDFNYKEKISFNRF